jgi:hypothetical protein
VFAALVWYDFPGSLIGSKALVNDLDLGFQRNPAPGATTFAQTRADNTNTVERAELTGLAANEKLVFVVKGTRIVHQLLLNASYRPDTALPQRWALAVVGHYR